MAEEITGDLDERLIRWVESTAGGRIRGSERPATGSSRATYLLSLEKPDGTLRECVLRVDTGSGPVAGTELTLAREAKVYGALTGKGIAIPALIATTPEGDAILVERATGRESLDDLDSATRAQVMEHYTDAIADLHCVPARDLELAGFHRPETGIDHALGDLALWRRVFDARVTRPAPLARFTFDWLGRHAPKQVERTVLCHGDVGPGNFLHEDGLVTALLDWEFAHLGDPMDDLAWLAFRGHHMNADVGDFAEQLRRWSERTGLAIDPGRIAYYRAFVMLRWLVACLSALDGGAKEHDRNIYFHIVPLLGALLPRALAELAEVELDPDPAPPVPRESDTAEILASIASDVASVFAPQLSGEAARRAQGLNLLLIHLQAADRLGEAVRNAELEDLAGFIGKRSDDPIAARRALEAHLAESAPPDDVRTIRLFARLGQRQLALWPYLIPVAARPLVSFEAFDVS
ncbi:MAG: phosphotransferase family protein [bacterium]|nr:phosphotransferase family protein [bacterium]